MDPSTNSRFRRKSNTFKSALTEKSCLSALSSKIRSILGSNLSFRALGNSDRSFEIKLNIPRSWVKESLEITNLIRKNSQCQLRDKPRCNTCLTHKVLWLVNCSASLPKPSSTPCSFLLRNRETSPKPPRELRKRKVNCWKCRKFNSDQDLRPLWQMRRAQRTKD